MSKRPADSQRRTPIDWIGVSLPILALVSFVLGTWGFWQVLPCTWSGFFDAAYRSLQMFFLNFEHPEPVPNEIDPVLQVARFCAFVTAIGAILRAFFPQVRQNALRWMRRINPSCALILGYGPLGQAIGAAARQEGTGIRMVTAVHPAVTLDLAARARKDGVLLVEGDPSDPRTLGRVFAQKAKRIYVSDTDDLRAIDTVVAVRQYVAAKGADIRVVLNDSDIANQMAEAVDAGFLGAPDVRWFSVADETAQQLIAEARFDRVAVETSSPRMHVVIVGGGSQGEAIAVEALLTGWRTGLEPPRITFIDRNKDVVEARMRRRMPAFFPASDGSELYSAARVQLEFLFGDAETLEFARNNGIDTLRSGVSGWVFATGDDGLNLRASLGLHRAIVSRRIDPAPIYVRISSGHTDEAPQMQIRPLSMARTFGAIDDVIFRSHLLADDPDALPRHLHDAYANASKEMGLDDRPQTWDSLPETKRNANRALFRHARMKLEDLEIQTDSASRQLPSVDRQLGLQLARIDDALDYAKIDPDRPPEDWLKAGFVLEDGDAETARTLLTAALCEHNRWIAARAIEQFVPTKRPERSLRDEERREHDNMHDWFSIKSPMIRRFDVVMLRALMTKNPTHSFEGKPAQTRTVFLPVLLDGTAGDPVVLGSDAHVGEGVTELRLHLRIATQRAEPLKLVPALMERLAPYLSATRPTQFRRLRFDFASPPGEQTLILANALAEAVRRKHGASIEVAPHWGWHAAPGPVIGVVGHRDLTSFGSEEAVTEQMRQTFMELVIRRGANSLVCGYAPGADQAAVNAWNSLGLPVARLIFPFSENGAKGERFFLTDDPVHASANDRFSESRLDNIGRPTLPPNATGHSTQADEILRASTLLVAIIDESDRPRKAMEEGGTRETVTKAKQAGMEIVRIVPTSGVDGNE